MKSSSYSSYFLNDSLPRLEYITNQIGGKNWIDRPVHSHKKTAEINIILEGTAECTVDAAKYKAVQGDIILCNPGIPHEISLLTKDLPNIICIGITDFKRPELPENHLCSAADSPVRSCGDLFPSLRKIAEYLYDSIQDAKESPVFQSLFESLMTIILNSIDSPDNSNADTNDSAVALRTKKYIDEHFTEDLSLDKISEALHCSAPYISHTFKAAVGYSPMQYLTRCRIGLAQSYLIDTNYNATQIATLVGFNTTNYFTSVFTRIVGVTPIQYRKKFEKEIGKKYDSPLKKRR